MKEFFLITWLRKYRIHRRKQHMKWLRLEEIFGDYLTEAQMEKAIWGDNIAFKKDISNP